MRTATGSTGLRLILGVLLVVEALDAVAWIAGLLPSLGMRGVWIGGLIGLRGVVGAAEMAAGALLLSARPPGRTLARAALLASALLMTGETGFRLAPSNLDSTFRWWFVAGYWVYAAAWIWWLGRVSEPGAPGQSARLFQ